jgi:hypothetical protein
VSTLPHAERASVESWKGLLDLDTGEARRLLEVYRALPESERIGSIRALYEELETIVALEQIRCRTACIN